MAKKEQKKKRGRERLQHSIELCRSVEEKGLDPFIVDVEDIISIVREYFSEWELPEELVLDAETIHQLSSVIKLQSDWVKIRSSSLYTDPFLLDEKIQRLDKDKMANLFLRVWNPIVEMGQISTHSLTQAIRYWQDLLPLKDRWEKTAPVKVETGVTTREEMIKQRILSEKAFSEEMESLWKELKQRVGKKDRIRYWEFIFADTYSETVERAYMTSFLVTYGYATLEIYRLEEEVFIKPNQKPESLFGEKGVRSIPISICVEDWKKWKENDQG